MIDDKTGRDAAWRSLTQMTAKSRIATEKCDNVRLLPLANLLSSPIFVREPDF
jgi:hypothetical protein